MEDNALLGGGDDGENWGLLLFHPMLGGRGCLLHQSLVGGNAGEVGRNFFVVMHGRWLRLYVSGG